MVQHKNSADEMENIVLESDIIWREKMWNSIWLQYPDITKNVQYPSAIVY